MIDLHCHILPNVDDGAKTLEESVEMAHLASEDGIRAIVATPHTLNGVYTNSVESVISGVASLQHASAADGIALKLYPGADVHLCTRMAERVERGEFCTIDNAGKYLLLELPLHTLPTGIKNEIFALKLNGITPIITHPERNAVLQHDPGLLYDLICMGTLAQVTAMSLAGDFGDFIEHVSATLLKHRMIHIIASDAHSSNDRPPVLSKAVERAGNILKDYDEAEAMVTSAPASILAGQAPDIPEPGRLKRSAGHF